MTDDSAEVELVLWGLLSERERRAYDLSRQGLDPEEIAERMDITEGTLRGMNQRIRDKRREASELARVRPE